MQLQDRASTSPATPWYARFFSFPVVLAAALMTTLFLFTTINIHGNNTIIDPDIWWHLANVRHLMATGHLLRQDIYSFTVNGSPWVDFEWLAEVPYYIGYQWLGERGIFLVMIAVAEAILLGIFILCYLRSENVKASFLAACVAIPMMTVSLGPRTLLFGWLCLIFELAILWSYRKGRDATWLLPPVFLLWINLHGSWFLGFGLLVIFVTTGFLPGRRGDIESPPWTTAQKKKLLTVTVVTFAALFINPFGWRMVEYPIDMLLRQSLMMKFLAEWATLDFHGARGKYVLVVLLGLGVLNLARRRTWQLSDLLFALIAIYGAVTYTRFVFLAGILLCPLLAIDFSNLLGEQKPREEKAALNAIVLLALAVFAIARNPSRAVLHEGIANTYPEAALARIRQLPANARVLNYYEWGGYLIWNTPQLPIFIDGRTDIFVYAGVMQDYGDAQAGNRVLDVLDKYRIQYVLFPKGGPLPDLLTHAPDWKVAYDQGGTMLFQRVPGWSK